MSLPKMIPLKDGQIVFIREPEMKDAPALLEFVHKIDTETRYMMREPDESAEINLHREKSIIRYYLGSEGLMWMIMVSGSKVMGTVGITLVGRRRKYRHRAEIGVAVAKEYWGIGVAKTLMLAAEEYAVGEGIERLELTVGRSNTAAIALYEKLGYVRDGEIEHAVRYSDGTYEDEIRMHKDI